MGRLGGRGREAERRVSRSCRLWAASAHSYTYLQVHRKDRQHSFIVPGASSESDTRHHSTPIHSPPPVVFPVSSGAVCRLAPVRHTGANSPAGLAVFSYTRNSQTSHPLAVR